MLELSLVTNVRLH